MDTNSQFRALIPDVEPEKLTHADRAALLNLLERAFAAKSSEGGGLLLCPSVPDVA